MASRANKYASLNFNDIYEKKIINPSNKQHPSSASSSSPSPLTSPSKTILSNSRIHGNMLVLSRPSPKPIIQPSPPPPAPLQPQQQPPQHHHHHHHQQQTIPEQIRSESDAISLRPLGRTGSGPSIAPSPLTLPKPDKEFSPSPSPSPKTDRFVPPHLRPGFVGREEKPVPEFHKHQGVRTREFGGHRQGHFGSPNSYGEDGRPKSGSGYERMPRGGDSDLMVMNRPGSSGTRPSSSG